MIMRLAVKLLATLALSIYIWLSRSPNLLFPFCCFGNWYFPFLSCKFSLKHTFDFIWKYALFVLLSDVSSRTVLTTAMMRITMSRYVRSRNCSTANHGDNWVVESCWRLVLASWCWMFEFLYLISCFLTFVLSIGCWWFWSEATSRKEPRNVWQYQEKRSRWVFYSLKISIFLAETQWWYPV